MVRIYDSPDGQDCGEKALETTKLAFKAGSFWAIYEMVGRSQPATIGGIATRYMYWTVPAVGLGITFAATGCVVGSMRGKDDFWNHMIAGASSAAVIGARYGPKNGFTWAIVLGGAAGLCKYVKSCGYDIYNPTPKKQQLGTFDHYQRHFGPRREVKPPPEY